MAMRPLKPCRHIGCPELVSQGYCSKHEPPPRDYDIYRGTAASRGYNYKWTQFRSVYIKHNPLCVDCLDHGDITPTVDIHHKVKLRDGGKRLDASNCMALCHSCHSVRTARGE